MVTANLVLCVLATVILQINCTFGANNRARSSIPPLNMKLSDIPQFLTITIDDALHGDSHDKTGLIMNHLNRNNEPIPLIYFVSNKFSDYSFVQKRYLEGCEIAVHTVTHTTSVSTDLTKWYNEIKQSRDLISEHSDIPLTEIVGFRAPFLEKSDISFQVLNGLEFLYDSTTMNKLEYNNLFDWPYTLDIYEPGFVYTVGEGPKQSYPGLWEIPMYYLYKNITTKDYMESMDYVGGYDELFDIFKANFLHRMNTNRAPMGLYFHAPWFIDTDHVSALNDFIDYVLSLDNTWIVDNKEIINWINNPIANQQYSYINNNQLQNNIQLFTTCQYTEGFFWTVQTECPIQLPHDLKYDDTQLFSSEITILSTYDNIITTSNDICINETYINYESSSAYCSNQNIQEIVQYNNIIYKCLWWTQNETPGNESVWQLIKECIQPKITFIKGIIEPYGQQIVFQDSVLEININIMTPKYDLIFNGISVTMNDDNNVYDLSIFDDYEFIKNHEINSVKLIIRFIEIIHSQYQIKISLKDITDSPTNSPTISSYNPSKYPTFLPTKSPSQSPTQSSINPTITPTINPTISPTINDLCVYDEYIFYNSNITYCENEMGLYQFIRYNDILYQCRFATQSIPENDENAWIFRKKCVDDESIDEQNDKIIIFKGMTMSKSVMIATFSAIGIILLLIICVCILLCCIIRKQEGKYELKMKELEAITDYPSPRSIDVNNIIHSSYRISDTFEIKGIEI